MRIEAKTLKTMVDVAARAADKRASMPILGNVAIEATGGRLTLRATDLDVHVTMTAPCTGGDVAAVAVDAKRLKAIVGANKRAGGIDLERVGDDKAAIDVGGRAFTVAAMPGEEFPAAPCVDVADAPGAAYDDPAHLTEALTFALAAASSDTARAHLNGVAFEGACVLSTDGHRLHRANGLPAVTGQHLVPSRGVRLLADAIRALKPEPGAVAVRFAPGYAVFMIAGSGVEFVAHVKLVDAAFPPYDQVIPKSYEAEVSVNADALAEACGMAMQIVDKSPAAITLTACAPGLAHGATGAVLTVAADAADVGEFAEHVPCLDATGPERRIGVNARLVREACADVGPHVRVRFVGGELDPITIEGRGTLAVIMPMRL